MRHPERLEDYLGHIAQAIERDGKVAAFTSRTLPRDATPFARTGVDHDNVGERRLQIDGQIP